MCPRSDDRGTVTPKSRHKRRLRGFKVTAVWSRKITNPDMQEKIDAIPQCGRGRMTTEGTCVRVRTEGFYELQCGHGQMNAEGIAAQLTTSPICTLQFGRSHMNAEWSRCLSKSTLLRSDSMWPRFDDCGRRHPFAPATPTKPARRTLVAKEKIDQIVKEPVMSAPAPRF